MQRLYFDNGLAIDNNHLISLNFKLGEGKHTYAKKRNDKCYIQLSILVKKDGSQKYFWNSDGEFFMGNGDEVEQFVNSLGYFRDEKIDFYDDSFILTEKLIRDSMHNWGTSLTLGEEVLLNFIHLIESPVGCRAIEYMSYKIKSINEKEISWNGIIANSVELVLEYTNYNNSTFPIKEYQLIKE